MSATRGLVAGVLLLSIGEAVLSSESNNQDPVGSVVGLFAGAFRRLVDPTVPLIPDTRSGHSDSSVAKPAGYVITPTPPATARPAASGQTILNA